ncbi:S9 family peptidase [Bounagaea algeriensis]
MASESFPRHSARTQGFTLGTPRTSTICPAANLVVFLRSHGPTDRRNALWALDLDSGAERLLADPSALQRDEEPTEAEKARRERARERATGITGYATDSAGDLAVFALSGEVFATQLPEGATRPVVRSADAADPRPCPHGRHIAYLSGGRLHVATVDGSDDRVLSPAEDTATWGHAEFIAAEEMRRSRGYWWSPDGEAILATRVDETPVERWYLAEPAEPATPPREVRYPAAGTSNADVRAAVLWLDGQHVDIRWDRANFPYLVAVHWSPHGSPLLLVQTRDQRTQVVLALDPRTGDTREIHRDTDEHWVEIKTGWPAWTPDGRLVRIAADGDHYHLVVGDEAWTAAPLQVHRIIDVDEDVLVAGAEDDPAEVHLYRVTADGPERLTREPGVHGGTRAGDITVIARNSIDAPRTTTTAYRGGAAIATLTNHADAPRLDLRVNLLRLGGRDLRSALLLPSGQARADGPLPVLVDPYGGPQAQRVLAQQQGYFTSQWFADQGFAVLVTDGRGTGGRGPAWDRAVAGDLAGPPLQDQVDALHAAAEQYPELDLARVAVRGWSFGGYLAALGVLQRPDVFHAAVIGAGVADWRLYDTHYTERYLGDPAENPDVYAANSLLRKAGQLTRPALVVHGTVDDNVAFAHALRLSRALTAAARPHAMLPLPGVTHMPTDESTLEQLLLMQVDFLHRSLGPG